MKYEVSQPIDPTRTPRPEGVYYQLEEGGHVMYAFFGDPDRTEVNAFQHGKVELAVYSEHPALFMLAQFGALPWVDAPFSWHLVPDGHKPQFDLPEEATKSTQELLSVVLADARNTIVRALRVVSMPRAVSDAVREAMKRQAVAPWDARQYDRALARITSKLTTAQMLSAAHARGVAGK